MSKRDEAKALHESILGAFDGDGTGLFVSMMTGIRNQFIEAGWHEAVAEQFVLEMYRQTAGGQS